MTQLKRPKYLRPQEVADLFDVSPKTVGRWRKLGLLKGMKTLGGHSRYPEDEVLELHRKTQEDQQT